MQLIWVCAVYMTGVMAVLGNEYHIHEQAERVASSVFIAEHRLSTPLVFL